MYFSFSLIRRGSPYTPQRLSGVLFLNNGAAGLSPASGSIKSLRQYLDGRSAFHIQFLRATPILLSSRASRNRLSFRKCRSVAKILRVIKTDRIFNASAKDSRRKLHDILPPQNTSAAESADFSDMKVSAKFLGAGNPQNAFSKNHDDFCPPLRFRHFCRPEHTNCPIANRWFKRRVGMIFGFRITYFVFHGADQSHSGVEGSPVRKEKERDREPTTLFSTNDLILRPRNLQNHESLYRVRKRRRESRATVLHYQHGLIVGLFLLRRYIGEVKAKLAIGCGILHLT